MVCGKSGRIRVNVRIQGIGLTSSLILGSGSEDFGFGFRIAGSGPSQVTSRDFKRMPGFNCVPPPFQIRLIRNKSGTRRRVGLMKSDDVWYQSTRIRRRVVQMKEIGIFSLPRRTIA